MLFVELIIKKFTNENLRFSPLSGLIKCHEILV